MTIDSNTAFVAYANKRGISGTAYNALRDAFMEGYDAATLPPATPDAAAPAWQPIANAPKDAMILLGRAKNEAEDLDAVSTAGRWQEGWEDSVDDMGCDSGFVDVDYQIFSPSRSFGAESHRHASTQPTHWMPLPDAPVAAAAGVVEGQAEATSGQGVKS